VSALDDLIEDARQAAETESFVCPDIVPVMAAKADLAALRRERDALRGLLRECVVQIRADALHDRPESDKWGTLPIDALVDRIDTALRGEGKP